MEKLAQTQNPIHELLTKRFSPRAFADKGVAEADLKSLLEAASWAASAYNDQPWRYIVANKQESTEEYAKMLSCLIPFNQAWAQSAPVLIIACAAKNFSFNAKPNLYAWHDLGLANAQMGIEAASRGIMLHFMAGFDAATARSVYNVPEDFDPVVAIALGYAGNPDTLPPDLKERELAPRVRKPIKEIAFKGSWGK